MGRRARDQGRVRGPAAGHVGRGRDEGRCAGRARRRQRDPAGAAVRTGRRRGGVQDGRRGARAHVHHAGRAAEPDGVAWLRGQMGRPAPDPLGVDAGRLRRADGRGPRAEHPAGQHPRHRPLHGRRVRRQALPRQVLGDGGAAREEDRPPGALVPLPRAGLPQHGQPAGQHHHAQGRREEGRHAGRARSRKSRVGRRLLGRRHGRRRLRHPRALRLPERALREPERLHQRRAGAAVPGARPPAGRVGARNHDGRPGRQARHGSDRAAAEEHHPGQPDAQRQPAVHVAPDSRTA